MSFQPLIHHLRYSILVFFAFMSFELKASPVNPESWIYSLIVTIDGKQSALGTAYAVSPFRLITSLDHVLSSVFQPGQRQILISNTAASMRAELVFVDPYQNLAVLQTSTSLPTFPNSDLHFRLSPLSPNEKLIVMGTSSQNNFIKQDAFYIQPIKIEATTQHQVRIPVAGPLLGAPLFDAHHKIAGLLNRDGSGQTMMNDGFSIQSILNSVAGSDPSIQKQMIKYLVDTARKRVSSMIEFRDSQPIIFETWTAGLFSKSLLCTKEDQLKSVADQYQIQITGSQTCETPPAFYIAPGVGNGTVKLNFRALNFHGPNLKLSQKLAALDKMTNSESMKYITTVMNSKLYNTHKCTQIQMDNRTKTTLLVKVCTATMINFPELHTTLVRIAAIDQHKDIALATIRVDLMNYETSYQIINRVMNELGHSL